MIIASPNIVLPDAWDNGNNPVFGYRNLVTTSNITVSSENADFPGVNLANPATDLLWKASSAAAQTITINTTGLGPIDYVGIARHNIADAGITASIKENVGSGLVAVPYTSVLPGDNQPLMFRLNRSARTQVQIVLSAGDAVPFVGVVYVGQLMVSQRRVYVGHTPINMGRSVKDVVGISEEGDYLGRIILSESQSTQFAIQNITPSFYRTHFVPFVKAVSLTTPCFFAWRPLDYPDEVGYGWFRSTPRPVNQRNNGMMSVTLEFGAISQ